MIEQTAFDEVAKFVVGFVGGVLSLQFVSRERTRVEKIIMAVTGTFVAGFGTPALMSFFALTPEYSNALAFVLGMYGWSLTGGVMNVLRQTKWTEIIDGHLRKRDR